ncbi:hypothetical protein R6Q57_025878 [Mikania cordata]
MGWTWKEEYLDLILVPSGFWIMCTYHLFLLHRYLKHPQLTAIGYENNNKNAWVKKMLLIEPKDRGFAVSVLSGQLIASTSLSTISLVLCSLIGAVIGNSSGNYLTDMFIYGDTSKSTTSIKYIMLLLFFLLAFACFVQTSRHFVHAGFLISMATDDVPVECIQKAMIRGGNFWAVGLRALYFATTLLLWIFGPIPMFVGAVATVMILHFLDTNKEPMIVYRTNKNGADGGRFLKRTVQEVTTVVAGFQHNIGSI